MKKQEEMQLKSNVSREFRKAAIVGGLTGIRSTAGLKHVFNQSNAVRAFAWMEMIADKMPFVPARTQSASLLARAGFGGYAAASFASQKRQRITYAAIGAISAVLCAFAATKMRTQIGEKSRVSSALLGFAEDGVVEWAGRSLLSS
jgi:uncharacterized membrane protein